MPKFSHDAVTRHIRRHHPRCPDFAVEFFATEVVSKHWVGVSLGKAVGITMQNYLRHNHTNYEGLLLAGVDRLEARAQVQPRINAILKSWKKEKRQKLTAGSGQGVDEAVSGEEDSQ